MSMSEAAKEHTSELELYATMKMVGAFPENMKVATTKLDPLKMKRAMMTEKK